MAEKIALIVTGPASLTFRVKAAPRFACELLKPKTTISEIPASTNNIIPVLNPAPVFTPVVLIQVRTRINRIAVSFIWKAAKG